MNLNISTKTRSSTNTLGAQEDDSASTAVSVKKTRKVLTKKGVRLVKKKETILDEIDVIAPMKDSLI